MCVCELWCVGAKAKGGRGDRGRRGGAIGEGATDGRQITVMCGEGTGGVRARCLCGGTLADDGGGVVVE